MHFVFGSIDINMPNNHLKKGPTNSWEDWGNSLLGLEISPANTARVFFAAAFTHSLTNMPVGGLLVACGYKIDMACICNFFREVYNSNEITNVFAASKLEFWYACLSPKERAPYPCPGTCFLLILLVPYVK